MRHLAIQIFSVILKFVQSGNASRLKNFWNHSWCPRVFLQMQSRLRSDNLYTWRLPWSQSIRLIGLRNRRCILLDAGCAS